MDPTEYGKMAEQTVAMNEPSCEDIARKLESFVQVKTVEGEPGCEGFRIITHISLGRACWPKLEFMVRQGPTTFSDVTTLPLSVLAEIVSIRQRFADWKAGKV